MDIANNKFLKYSYIKYILVIIIFVTTIFPLLSMLANIGFKDLIEVFGDQRFHSALFNSLSSSTIATVFSIIIGFVLAYIIERINFKFKSLFKVLFILPMLIPSIAHGMGLITLLGNNGIITKLLNLDYGIYGIQGVIVGSVMYSFPVSYLMFSNIIRYEDATPYEAAKVLGLTRLDQFKVITLPYLRKPLISIVFAIFTMIITDYGVPLTIGGKYITIPVLMYQEVIGQLDFAKGAIYGAILLIPAFIAFVLDYLNKDKGNDNFVSKGFTLINNKIFSILSFLYSIIISLFTLLPIMSFIIIGFTSDYPNNLSFSLDNINNAFSMNALTYLFNSVMIAICVSIIGSVLSFIIAYVTARNNYNKLLHILVIVSAAIPGIVLGLSYIIFFKESVIYGTIFILILVNTTHFIASPYLMMYNTLNKLNANLESVGSILGINKLYMIKDVFIPQCFTTLLEISSYLFVNSMMTISAVSFLSNSSNKPLSLMINQFEAQMQLEEAAIVALIILTTNLLVKYILNLISKKGEKQ